MCAKSGLKISPQGVRKWLMENSPPRMSNATKLAVMLGVGTEWLLSGSGQMTPQADKNDITRVITNNIHLIKSTNGETESRIGDEPGKQLEMESNVSLGPHIKGKVPLISWVQAGRASEVIDLLQPGDADEWIDSTVQIRRHTYALRVEGDSMSPEFPPGMILIVEPDMDPEIGDFVIARNGDDEATFKKYVKDGGTYYLKPLNPAYPIINAQDYRIVGVVRDAVRKLR